MDDFKEEAAGEGIEEGSGEEIVEESGEGIKEELRKVYTEEPRVEYNVADLEETSAMVKMSLSNKFIKVITSPKKAFAAISQDTRILWPALILLAITLITIIAILPETKPMTEQTLLKSGYPSDQIALSMRMVTIGAIVGGLVAMPIIWLLQAAILALYNQISVGEARFKQLFAVAVFSGIPGAISGLITTLLIKTMGYEAAMKVTTSLALFMGNADSTSFLYRLFQRIEVFSIWGLILLILGGATAMNKKPRGLAIYMAVIWFAFIIISALLGKNPAV